MKRKKLLKRESLVSILRINTSDYAIISPNKVVFITDASEDDIITLAEDEQQSLVNDADSEWLTTDLNQDANLTLIPTFDCNLRCVYCYSRGGDYKNYMSKEIAKAAIDSVRFLSKSQSLSLYFGGGGEPFVNFEIIKFATKYAKQLFNQVAIAIVTNGTFNDEQFAWIIDNDVSIRISCDGVGQACQRPFASGMQSSEVVERSIKGLVHSGRDFLAQCSVTSETVNSLNENVNYFANLGVKTLKIEPVHMSENCRGFQKLTPSPEKFAKNFIEMLKYILLNGLPIKIDTSYLSRPTNGYYCGVYGRNITVTPVGDITSCVEITRKSEPFSDTMLYGQVSLENSRFSFKEDALKMLKKLHYSNYRGGCRICSLKLICKGGCPMKNIFDNGFALERSRYNCKIEKLIVPKVFSLIIEDSRYSDLVFDNFQMRLC